MTTTARMALVTEGRFVPVKVAAELIGRPTRTLTRWCREAQDGKGPFVRVRVRQLGRPWEVHSDDLGPLIDPQQAAA